MSNRSEVFENYAAIAKEKGLLSEGEAYDPRVGSDDISTIEALYGIKPNGKDEKDIIDQAHPEPVIIGPAYDRINALVENGKERQNIMIGIIMKAPQAKLTQHRYASVTEDLTQELIRLGFKLDNDDQDDLRVLADNCAKGLRKEAWIPIAIGLLGAALGTIYAVNNHVYVAQGIHNDCQRAIDALNKLSAAVPAMAGPAGSMIESIQYIQKLNDDLVQARATMPISHIDQPETTVKAVQLAKDGTVDEATKLLSAWKSVVPEFVSGAHKFLGTLKGVSTSPNLSSDLWAGIKKVWHSMKGGDEVGDVFKAFVGKSAAPGKGEPVEDGLLGELLGSISEMQESHDAMISYVSNNHGTLTKHLQDVAAKSQKTQAPPTMMAATPKSIAPPKDEESDLLKQLM